MEYMAVSKVEMKDGKPQYSYSYFTCGLPNDVVIALDEAYGKLDDEGREDALECCQSQIEDAISECIAKIK